MSDITIKLPVDDTFSHPTMGKSAVSLMTPVNLPKGIYFEDEFIDLTDVAHIVASKDGGFIKYKDGRELHFDKERVWKLRSLLFHLRAADCDPLPEKRRKFRFNPFWLAWFLATLAMGYFIAMR